MNREKVADSLLKIAESLVGADEESALDGMTKQRAIRNVNKILGKLTGGLFSDDYWKPINDTFKLLSRAGIDYKITKTQYTKNSDGVPESKRWNFEIEFVNNRGRVNKLYGVIVASGAGTVADPLSRYDVVAYAS
jgi:hypothetical protein